MAGQQRTAGSDKQGRCALLYLPQSADPASGFTPCLTFWPGPGQPCVPHIIYFRNWLTFRPPYLAWGVRRAMYDIGGEETPSSAAAALSAMKCGSFTFSATMGLAQPLPATRHELAHLPAGMNMAAAAVLAAKALLTS